MRLRFKIGADFKNMVKLPILSAELFRIYLSKKTEFFPKISMEFGSEKILMFFLSAQYHDLGNFYKILRFQNLNQNCKNTLFLKLGEKIVGLCSFVKI